MPISGGKKSHTFSRFRVLRLLSQCAQAQMTFLIQQLQLILLVCVQGHVHLLRRERVQQLLELWLKHLGLVPIHARREREKAEFLGKGGEREGRKVSVSATHGHRRRYDSIFIDSHHHIKD